MTTKTLILISSGTGPQSGKSTLASHLRKAFTAAPIVSFATPLKEMLEVFLGWWLPDLDGEDSLEFWLSGGGKEKPLAGLGDGCDAVTPRKLMQTLGTEWRTLIDEKMWTKIMQRRLGVMFGSWGEEVVIIDDLRFAHELAEMKRWAKARDVQVIHIHVLRPSNPAPTSKHASEGYQWDPKDIQLTAVNNVDLREFLAGTTSEVLRLMK